MSIDDDGSDVTLGEVSEIRSGWTSRSIDVGPIKMVRAGDLNTRISWQSILAAETVPPNLADYLLHDGDVLIGRSGVGSVGKTQAVRSPPPDAIFASYILRARPAAGWHGPYIAFHLQSRRGQAELRARALGASNLNLSRSRISSIPVPRLPWGAQVDLAERLYDIETALLEAADLVQDAEQALAKIRQDIYPAALDAVEHRSRAKSWPEVKLSSITENLDRLRIALNIGSRETRDGEYPYYGASGIIDEVDEYTHDGTCVLLSEDGNNLITRRKPIAFVASGKFWANNHVHVLQPKEAVDPWFLALQLNHVDVQPLLTGTAQPKLTKQAMQHIDVPLPPLDIQQAIVMAADRLSASYADLADRGREIRDQLHQVWDATLDAALSTGSLSAQFPQDVATALQWVEQIHTLEAFQSESPRFLATGGAPAAVTTDEQAIAAGGWVRVEAVFNRRYAVAGAAQREQAVDAFYAWLKDGIVDNTVEVRQQDNQIYLRVSE